MPETASSLAATITGADAPGLLSRLMGAIASTEAEILDLEQTVVRGQLSASLELWVSDADVAALRPALAKAAAASGFDVSVSPAGLSRRGRRLIVMDVDSTLIRDEVIELLAAHAGCAEAVREVTEAAMRGEVDFAESLRSRVRLLAGLPVGVLDEVRAAVQLTPGARTLVATLRDLGLSIGVVSGGFIEIVQAQLPNRHGDWDDLVADVVGLLCGLLLAAALRRVTAPARFAAGAKAIPD